jgi:HSP20 family protein
MSHDENDDEYDDENEDSDADEEDDEKDQNKDNIISWIKDSNWFEGFDPEIFKDIDMSQFEKFIENLMKQFHFPDSTEFKGGPMVWGFSINVGPNKKPLIRQIGNLNPQRQKKVPQDKVPQDDPPIDIIEEDNLITVLTEITGITKSDIKLDTTETRLKLSINTPQRKLSKDITLPAVVIPESAKAWYKNGVLEIKMKKKESKKNGTPINVT